MGCSRSHKANATVQEKQDGDEEEDEGYGNISHAVSWYLLNTLKDNSQNLKKKGNEPINFY